MISKDTTKEEVLTTITKSLTAVFGTKQDMLNAWMDNDKKMRMLIPAVPSKVVCRRKNIGKKQMEENKQMRMGYRFPKTWGGARTTGLTSNTTDHSKPKRLVEKEVMWKGVQRHVQMMDMNKIGEFKHSSLL